MTAGKLSGGDSHAGESSQARGFKGLDANGWKRRKKGPRPVRRYWHSQERGLRRYGKPVVCSYGTVAMIYDSSAAYPPHVWLNVQHGPDWDATRKTPGEASMHMNARQVRALVARLSAWLEDHS